MIYLIVALLMLTPSAYQDDCGNGLPCGPVPWALPALPVILSPTPYPTVIILATATPTASMTPSNTPDVTATRTPMPTYNPTGVYDAVGEIESRAENTAEPITIDGLDYSIDSLQSSEHSATLFSYILGIFTIDIGKLTILLRFGVFAFGATMAFKISTWAIPIIGVLIGVVRKALEFIIGLIPGL